jgi:hypothetical protein
LAAFEAGYTTAADHRHSRRSTPCIAEPSIHALRPTSGTGGTTPWPKASSPASNASYSTGESSAHKPRPAWPASPISRASTTPDACTLPSAIARPLLERRGGVQLHARRALITRTPNPSRQPGSLHRCDNAMGEPGIGDLAASRRPDLSPVSRSTPWAGPLQAQRRVSLVRRNIWDQ